MRLICPNCDAQYEVAEDAIPEEGRDVQCSSCGHAWYQLSPAALAAQAAEAELFEAAEPVTPPPPEVALEVEDPVEPVAAPPVAATISSTRNLDEDALALLREEAEREVQARSRDENRLEVQGDLGLEPAAAGAAARRVAQLKGMEADNPGQPEPLVKPTKGRDLLPDIEEINSTLRPESGGLAVEEGRAGAADPRGSRRSFRLGFGVMVLAALLVVVLYMFAPRIGAAVPALAGVMDGYVASIDALRLGLDGLMQQASAWLQA